MKNTIMKTIPVLAALLAGGIAAAAQDRILEISGDGNRIIASVEFLNADGGALPGAEMDAKRFEWFAVPEGAAACRLKVGGITSARIGLPDAGHLLVTVKGLDSTKRGDGATVVGLNIESGAKDKTPPRKTGIIYFGQLKPPFDGDAQWNSLYLVMKESRMMPDKDNAGTKQVVEEAVIGKEMSVDFPLYLRQWNDAANRPLKNAGDPIVRAGQTVKVTGFTAPDSKGNVYAMVEVL
jgi:hypothetical protein